MNTLKLGDLVEVMEEPHIGRLARIIEDIPGFQEPLHTVQFMTGGERIIAAKKLIKVNREILKGFLSP